MEGKIETVLIGKKPIANYVSYIASRKADKLKVKARGKLITKAVDVVEVLKRRMISSLKVDKIELGTEELRDKEGQIRRVSTIEIIIS